MKPSAVIAWTGLGVFVFLNMIVGLCVMLVAGVVFVVEKVKESE